MICAFTQLTTDLKIQGFNPGFHIMDNETSAELKMTINTMYIKYQFVPPGNQRDNNVEIDIQAFKNHFI